MSSFFRWPLTPGETVWFVLFVAVYLYVELFAPEEK
jgi:hypothetical protein